MQMISLEDKREMMFKFLLENIVVKTSNKKRLIEKKGSEIYFTSYKGEERVIKCFSKPEEVGFTFTSSRHKFDEDRRMLNEIHKYFLELINNYNKKGVIPGFIFLRAETDYTQFSDRTNHLVNYGNFIKQFLPNEYLRKPLFDVKNLHPLFLAFGKAYMNSDKLKDKKRLAVFRGSTLSYDNKSYVFYRPKGIVYNIKENRLEEIWTLKVGNLDITKLKNCPVCDHSNEEDYSHDSCKDSTKYLDYVKLREHLRYTLYIKHSKVRDKKIAFHSSQLEDSVNRILTLR